MDDLMIKKPWSDAPHVEGVEDYIDPIEAKLALNCGGGGTPSGGGGGGGGGGGNDGGGSAPRPRNRPKPKPKPKAPPPGYKFGGGQPQPGSSQGGTGYGVPDAQGGTGGGYVGAGAGRQGAFVRDVDGTMRRSSTFQRKEGLYGEDALRFDPTAFYASGIRGFGRGRQAVEQGRRIEAMSESGVPLDSEFTVESQRFADAVGGGEPGVGEQGFGRRAMLGGEGELAEDLSGVENYQTEMPAEVAASDLEGDPNAMAITPEQNIIPDVNYLVPTVERDDQQIAFIPGEGAGGTATGPLSRNLTGQRRGFGASIVVY